MTDQQIIAELDRIERGLNTAIATGQAACLDAMAEIEKIMGGLGVPPAKKDAPYGEWCRKPSACAGKGYCPLDPTCGD